ncbi:MAG: hypothetical protein HFG41_10445 [Coprococcus sp.]|nr:hypothetical protein [Coprococcus sp.]
MRRKDTDKKKGISALRPTFEKIKWLTALILLAGIICGSYTLSQYVAGEQIKNQEAEVILDPGHGGCR